MKSHQLLILFFLLLFSSAKAQDSYVVKGEKVNVRMAPKPQSKVLGQIPKGEVVAVIDSENKEWWKISYYGDSGYVSSRFLEKVESSEKYKSWEKHKVATGDNPECDNISPQYDTSINNKLIIHAGNNLDVVVKLMTLDGTCIRIAFINAGETYTIRNIPEDKYYLKVAYGNDFRKSTENGQCLVRFLRNSVYEIGDQILDYYKIKKADTIEGDYVYKNWDVPSYELSLNVVFTKASYTRNNFKSRKISEREFNK